MENTKEKSSRSGSKSDLNESSFPLLEGGEEIDLKASDDNKVMVELQVRESEDCKDDDSKEKGADGKDSANDEKGKKKKEKKEKKKKEKTHVRTCSFADRLTAGLNLLDRDDRSVNDHINIVFEDVLAEPDSNQGFDATWRLAFLTFSGTKVWVYRILSAILAIPCGLLWGLIFSLLVLMNVWLISPLLHTFSVAMHILHKLWSGVVRTVMDPIFQSFGQLFSSINVNMTTVHQDVKEP